MPRITLMLSRVVHEPITERIPNARPIVDPTSFILPTPTKTKVVDSPKRPVVGGVSHSVSHATIGNCSREHSHNAPFDTRKNDKRPQTTLQNLRGSGLERCSTSTPGEWPQLLLVHPGPRTASELNSFISKEDWTNFSKGKELA